ncbi:MAG: hypothetical protein M1833_005310 [Piccolia ochrophora]|nr:MAG: hypothetical protein M1833_005310 [Piccolia ochrophora]
MSLFKKPLAGPGYIILNILRVLNIISLAAVMAASWVMLVKTFIVSKFFFFDAASHVIASAIAMFLIVSEIQLFKLWFATNWPLLSPSSGLIPLGGAMVVLGITILGNLNKEATSQKSLGLGFWRIVIASGILACVLGVFNIIASLIFRNPKQGVTSRQVRSYGAVAASKPPSMTSSKSVNKHSRSFINTHLVRQNSLPTREHHEPETRQPERRQSRRSLHPRLPMSISRPLNFNKQFREYLSSNPVRRPDDSHHPAHVRSEVV